jgi:hypothetical protein
MDIFLNLTQWPAMIITLVAAWLVASQTQHKRSWGFWRFPVSNVPWVVLGWHTHAYALIALQFGLCMLNVRGAMKNGPYSFPIRRENSVRGVCCAVASDRGSLSDCN